MSNISGLLFLEIVNKPLAGLVDIFGDWKIIDSCLPFKFEFWNNFVHYGMVFRPRLSFLWFRYTLWFQTCYLCKGQTVAKLL